MAFFSKDENRRVRYDLTDILVGESIFNKEDEDKYTYCVKLSDDEWKIFRYDEGEIHYFKIGEPSFYICPNNIVFDIEKTKWVREYFEKTYCNIESIKSFKININKSFM